MGDWTVFGNTKVTLSESFLNNMPASLNKVQYFEESFQDLKLCVSQDGGGVESYCLQGLWEAVIMAQHVLCASLKKWKISKTLEVSSKQLLDPQDICNTSLESEISISQQCNTDSFEITESNIPDNEEPLIVANCKSRLVRKCSKLVEKTKIAHQRVLEDRGRGTSPTRSGNHKLRKEQTAPLSSRKSSLCSVNVANAIEDADSPDLYYDQVTSVENEVYMDIQLEHNYNHLRSAETNDIGSDSDEPTIENEIYMDITLSKPNNEIFTDPDLPVTLVVAKEDEPEVLQLNVNKTNSLMSPQDKMAGEGKGPTDHQEHLKTRRKKYEDQAPFKYFCNQCSFKTKRHSHMRNHSRLHERICTIYSCDQCDFSTIRASHLQRHLGTHKTEVFACSECTYSSHSEALLNKHQRCKHTAKRPDEEKTKDIYQCLQCDYMTTSEKIFKRHLAVHTKKGKMKSQCFKCSHCSYQTPSRSNYYRHLSGVHGEERPFMCTTCGLCFKRSDTLTQHQATHGEKESGGSFQCLKCKKFYRSANALKEHQLTHEEDRSYLCEICAASFKTRAVQRKHYIQKHVRTKVNQCPTCSKSFSSRYLVKRHMKVHMSSKQNTGDCASRGKNVPRELQPAVSGTSGWCDSIVPVQPSNDVQVFVVHQEQSQAELSVQEGPLFQVTGQTLPVPVIPVEYVISTGDSENQNCMASHIPAGEGEIITLAFVQGN